MMATSNRNMKGKRGGWRPGSGRPKTHLVINLPKNWYARLVEWSQFEGKSPAEIATNLIITQLEQRRGSIPQQQSVDING